ncbi:unnamed protein product [Cladocopium goreaui]|uniref:Tyr recombinase domain-containing protein n=1 Tax=Cladocopium goreaui TaxID=2562237 RepID=A0A9P1CA95_9DINO|nr:unnamed protein product [Cladocopium goreaui]
MALTGVCEGWWWNVTQPPDEVHTRWTQFKATFPKTEAEFSKWYQWGQDGLGAFPWGWEFSASPPLEFNAWMLLDTLFGLVGWALFGSAWGGVKSGCRRLIQIIAVLLVCLAAHYVWAVCYPVVSILIACIMAVVWLLRRTLKTIGTLFFYIQRWTGGAPEAADTEFFGPGTGAVPETTVLRGFKKSGDNPKQVVVRRGDEVAVFSVGSDSQSIRTHGLYLQVEPDTVRGSANLVRRLNAVDKVHLCRNLACTEDASEHFVEYGVVKKFNAERFQVSQSHQGALAFTKQFWAWAAPKGQRTVTEVVNRIKEYASESENEEHFCCASQITWMTDEGLKSLAENRCGAVGQPFHQALEGDLPNGSTGSLCSKHATLYLSKRFGDKCGVVGCFRCGDKVQSGVRWCTDHLPQHGSQPTAPATRMRSRSRARRREDAEETDFEAAEEIGEDDEDPDNGVRPGRRPIEELTQEGGPARRSRKRQPTKSPGHTPKSNIQRNLARIEMLSSPGSEAEVKLLDAFIQKFADGRMEGLREDQVRSALCRDRVMTEVEVLRRLLEEADVERGKGQRGLTRFVTRWTKELAEKEKVSPESDWSLLSTVQSSHQESPGVQAPPIPPSFTASSSPQEGQKEDGSVFNPPQVRVYGRSGDGQIPSEASAVRRAESLRIAPPSLYNPNERKAGAVEEPVEQIAKALQNQTAELASLVRHQAEGAGSQPVGTLKGLGRQSEELVFLMRACGQYDVKVGENEHGQALANGLLAAQVGSATRLRSSGFRQKMTQRLAIGLAGPYWGAHEKHALSAADFIGYTDAELDQFASEARGPKGGAEQRPPPPTRFDEWVARVRRQTDVWCLVYGAEWRAVKNSALELLSEWHLSLPHRWPLNVIMDLWEELHWRCMEDFKDLLRKLKKEVGRETMTLSEVKFHALLPGPDGQAWLTMPTVFDLQRPGSWFQEEVIPRIDRKQDRLLWNLTLAEPGKERRQCVTLSLAAALFRKKEGRWPSMGEAQRQAQDKGSLGRSRGDGCGSRA